MSLYTKKTHLKILQHRPDQVNLEPKWLVWCVGSIGSFFFRDGEGHSVNLSGDNYLRMLQDLRVPELSTEANMQQFYFSTKMAHCLCAFLDERFPNQWLVVVVPSNRLPAQVISHHGIFFPLFLWGYNKLKLYELRLWGSPNVWRLRQWLPKCWSGMRETVPC